MPLQDGFESLESRIIELPIWRDVLPLCASLDDKVISLLDYPHSPPVDDLNLPPSELCQPSPSRVPSVQWLTLFGTPVRQMEALQINASQKSSDLLKRDDVNTVIGVCKRLRCESPVRRPKS